MLTIICILYDFLLEDRVFVLKGYDTVSEDEVLYCPYTGSEYKIKSIIEKEKYTSVTIYDSVKLKTGYTLEKKHYIQ